MKFMQACLASDRTGNRHSLRRLCPAKQRKPFRCQILRRVEQGLLQPVPGDGGHAGIGRRDDEPVRYRHTRVSIATLEEKLKGKKIEPPPHESFAQQTGSTGRTQ